MYVTHFSGSTKDSVLYVNHPTLLQLLGLTLANALMVSKHLSPIGTTTSHFFFFKAYVKSM